MKLFKQFVICLSIFSSYAFSAVHEVKMLNAGIDGFMVFEPAVLKVNKGDTINFIATDMAHNSESISGMIPAGAQTWSGKMSADVSVTLDTEGVYVYKCTPHMMMAMVGVIHIFFLSHVFIQGTQK